VRRAAGHQAAVLNRLVEDLVAMRGIREERLRELLGHTPFEVLAGAVLGLAIGLVPL
jgi:acid phosphatase family membrane protein YuiD